MAMNYPHYKVIFLESPGYKDLKDPNILLELDNLDVYNNITDYSVFLNQCKLVSLDIIRELRKVKIPASFNLCLSKDQFLKLNKSFQTDEKAKHINCIHLSMHGNEEAIEFTDGSQLSYSEFYQSFGESIRKKILITDGCFSGSAKVFSNNHSNFNFAALFGSNNEIKYEYLIDQYAVLHKMLSDIYPSSIKDWGDDVFIPFTKEVSRLYPEIPKGNEITMFH